MSKLLKYLLPNSHSSRRVIDVLNSMNLIEFTAGLCVIAGTLIVLPMVILLWDVRGAIA